MESRESERGDGGGAGGFRSSCEIAIHVFDLARAEAFYTRVLGARLVSRSDEQLELDTGSLRLFVNRDASTPRSYIPSFDVPDYAAARRQLETAGCRTVPAGTHADGVYFCDPFGFVFDIVERR
ncbi:MAG TPA: VOC family protein [Gemmatimonadaceae bacterium]